jgi:predicted permease
MLVSFLLLWKMKTPNKKVLWFAWSYSNAAYMGFPLVKGLFGDEGMIYASAFATVFNIIIWSVGYAIMSGETDGKKLAKTVIKSPVTCSVIVGLLVYLCRISVPEIIKVPIRMMGEATTPISMIIIGVMIAESRLKSILANKEIWLTVVVRLVLIPTLTFGLYYLFGIGGMVGSVILIQAASPTAATTSVLATQFNHDESIGAGTVVITTICSIVTLTIFALLLNYL